MVLGYNIGNAIALLVKFQGDRVKST